ncbi:MULTISPECIES: M6 family metalloprotease domain-containing protein [unclassified Streptomyces]|uniref:M6 family metalloprotease domain-containing protein n=1 Tax=unclassified Streptomyces TaxID=2593676 RepID=UPI0022514D30|nr:MULTISPECIES: M6 family metalloprotease domain-containing protein [unclassified Streptomyces]MCX4990707.1 M6 family metalloprotease domain-containing protein [Streptomyces sp. NBC_00568]MCX5004062.1 M6 family metalloprotease domain-containing protein [Streptomyces sp. NBC_00638]
MSRNPHPEVDVPRPLPLRALAREALRGLARDGAPRWRSTAAVFTSMTALAATSLVPGPALAEPLATPCALTRTDAHHSEGVDTWNSAYVRPTRPLDAVMVFLSFPDSTPRTTPAELTGDYFPATSRFFERASYGRFTVRPHPQRAWIQMPHPSTSYAIQRDWDAADRAAYLRDALAVADPRVDFSRYDVVYFVADPDAPGVDSDATKVVNLDAPLRADGKDIRRVVTVFEKHPPDRLVLAHETGHVFDLPDLYHRPSDGKGDWDTYVGDWDLMGSQFGLSPDLFGWHKWRLGWLESHQVACVQGSGVTRLTLEPLGAGPVSAAAGARAAGAPGAGVLAAGVPASASAAPDGPRASSWHRPLASWRGSEAAMYGPRAPSRGPGASTSSNGVGVAALPGSQSFGSGRGTKLAVVQTGPDSALAFEARGSAGNDDATCTEGILVYRVRSETESGSGPIQVLDAHPHTEACWEDSVYPPLADAPVGLGESFTVPGAKVRVEVEDRTVSGAWTVKITTG